VKGFRHTQNEKNSQTLLEESHLEAIYRQASEVLKALKIVEQILNTQRRTLDEKDSDTLYTMSVLANLYSDLNHHYESRNLSEETVKIQTRL